MQSAGFADVAQKQTPIEGALEGWNKLRESIRQLSDAVTSGRRTKLKV
jgi:hypothetical protein